MADDASSVRAAAFSSFYRREHGTQVRRAYVLLHSNEAANDVVHDAMVEVFRRWDDLAEPGAYLNRSVLNGCRDAGRRTAVERRHAAGLVQTPGAVEITVETPLDDLFDRLPFNQRAAVVLRYYADLSTAQIAEALDCPIGSIGPWIDRALTTLRQVLREERTT